MRRLPIFLILFFSIHLPAFSQQVFLRQDPTAVKIDEYFTALAKQEKFNGNVVVALGDRVILKRTYNIGADIDGLKTSIDKQFMIASVAKLFVKFSFLKLEEQGRI